MYLFDLFEDAGKKLVIFDIDDTLVNTRTQVTVRHNGRPVHRLNSHEFTHYKLKPGEEFDFGAFRNAAEFARESRPIVPMIQQLNADIATGNRVVMITARADFDDRDTFLNAFKRWDVDIDRVHVYRAGNDTRPIAVDQKKADIIRRLLANNQFSKAIMYDDSVPNLESFVQLHSEHPGTRFYAWHVDHAGRASEYHRAFRSESINEHNNENDQYVAYDKILIDLCAGIVQHQKQDSDRYGLVAAAVVDPKHRVVKGINHKLASGKREHAERAAMANYIKQHGAIPEHSIVVTTLSPCTDDMPDRKGPSCTELLNGSPITRVYAGYRDPSQTHLSHDDFDVVYTQNSKIESVCKQIADCFLKESAYTDPANYCGEGVAEGLEHYDGIEISMEKEADEIMVKAMRSGGRELGHVLFVIDGEYLAPQDLEVDERYRGQGIAQTMYDYVKSKGYKIRRSGQQTDAGAGFWDKHKPGKNIWEQDVAEDSDNNRVSFKVQKGKNKFATTLSIGGNPVGVYQYDANTGRSIAEVYPEFKGKGLGKLLVLHAIYTAAKLGLDFQEDESRTSEYDNVLDSLSSSGYIVDDDGYWYVTGEGEQFLKQSLKQGVAEAEIQRKESFRSRTTPDIEYIVRDDSGNIVRHCKTKKEAKMWYDMITLSQEEMWAKYPQLKVNEELNELMKMGATIEPIEEVNILGFMSKPTTKKYAPKVDDFTAKLMATRQKSQPASNEKRYSGYEEYLKDKEHNVAEGADQEVDTLYRFAQQHYPGVPDKQEAFVKFVIHSLNHSKEDDKRQDQEINMLDKEVDELQRQTKVTESADYLEEK